MLGVCVCGPLIWLWICVKLFGGCWCVQLLYFDFIDWLGSSVKSWVAVCVCVLGRYSFRKSNRNSLGDNPLHDTCIKSTSRNESSVIMHELDSRHMTAVSTVRMWKWLKWNRNGNLDFFLFREIVDFDRDLLLVVMQGSCTIWPCQNRRHWPTMFYRNYDKLRWCRFHQHSLAKCRPFEMINYSSVMPTVCHA